MTVSCQVSTIACFDCGLARLADSLVGCIPAGLLNSVARALVNQTKIPI